MTAVTANPLPVGLVGLTRDGWHLIESCAAGGPFQVVAVFDTDACRLSHGASLSVPVVSSLDMLTRSPHIDVLWVATPMGFEREMAEPLVEHDKHVVVETPLCLSTAVADRAFAAARARGRQLLVHCPRRANADARHAQSLVASGELGTVRAAKWISWGYGRAPTDVQNGASDGVASPRTTLIRLMAHVLDQLVAMLPSAPRRV
ncbi:MAG TPA: Gfo/Idh/MocA family oxidoreductase, partial [Planctomycetaceae bacterium]|nr:Gfo/Idh/MocA family oxidoreductase [Planctomycetaceae bacterium]